MNLNDFCLICKDEMKQGKHSLIALVQNGKAFMVHKWCFDELTERIRGKNNVMQKL